MRDSSSPSKTAARQPAETAVPNVIQSAGELLAELGRGAWLVARGGRWQLHHPEAAATAPTRTVRLAAVDELRAAGRLAYRADGGLVLVAAPPTSAARNRRPPRAADAKATEHPLFNEAESPLGWLRARKHRDGRPLIGTAQFLAGERLRADYERAALAPRVTANWELPASRGRGGVAPVSMSDGALAARQRYHAALAAVGEDLASILVQVCCLAAGIEQAERILDLPQRSGRVVLDLALTALARHYGLTGARRGAGMTRWGVPGFRPAIQPPEDDEDES